MKDWLTDKQKEYVEILKATNGRTSIAVQGFIDTLPGPNQIMAFNKAMKPFNKKLKRKGINYTWEKI